MNFWGGKRFVIACVIVNFGKIAGVLSRRVHSEIVICYLSLWGHQPLLFEIGSLVS